MFKFQYYKFRPFRFLPLKGVGAEVGVYRGDFSITLLKKKNVNKMYLVDPYRYENVPQMEQDALNKAKERAVSRTRGMQHKVTWLLMPSHEAASKIPEKLDFCYIDGDHSYEGVKKDLADYYPLVKPGGYFGGHDFHYDWPGVIKAVSEFAVNNGLALKVESPDWWFVIDEKK